MPCNIAISVAGKVYISCFCRLPPETPGNTTFWIDLAMKRAKHNAKYPAQDAIEWFRQTPPPVG